MAWKTGRLTDRAEVRSFLNRDRALMAYALGDLDDAFWPQSEFYGAWQAGRLQSIVLVYRGLTPAVLTGFGDVDGLRAIFEAHPLPREIYYLWMPAAEALLDEWYERPHAKREFRMVLDLNAFQPPEAGVDVQRLEPDDAPALEALFRLAAEPGEAVVAFSPYQIAHGAFYGVWRDGVLAAVAGTHVWSQAESVAAIGNVFTAQDFRGCGFATCCTAAVVRAAQAAEIETIVLNVRHDNAAAVHIYEKLGFRIYTTFLEGPGMMRPLTRKH